MGVPREDLDKIRIWSITLGMGLDSANADTAIIQQQQSAMQEFLSYLTHLIEKRRNQPNNDLISILISAHDNEGKISDHELLSMCFVLLFAGHETVTNLLGNGMLCLLHHPEQFTLLRHHPEYLPSAIEEMLRFESPFQRSTCRITTEDCEIGGKRLGKGEEVCAIIGAANRDPMKFPEPDKFDIQRTPNRHLAFGLGIHICLGLNLARTEATIGFKQILESMPDIQLADEKPSWRPNTFARGLQSLPVYIQPA